VHSAKGLPVRQGTSDLAPTAFVHYQVMHFPDSFTRAIPESHTPLFEHLERFPLPTNPQMLTLLAGSGIGNAPGAGCIEFTVLDDFGEDNADNVGSCRLPLALLAEGDPIFAKLPVVNDVDRVVAQLNVVVRWRHPFRTEKELGSLGRQMFMSYCPGLAPRKMVWWIGGSSLRGRSHQPKFITAFP